MRVPRRARQVTPTTGNELSQGSQEDATESPPTLPWYRKTFWVWSRLWGGALGVGIVSIPLGIVIHSLAEVLVGVGMAIGGAAVAAVIYHYSPPNRQ